jgi:potassium efflux system protein
MKLRTFRKIKLIVTNKYFWIWLIWTSIIIFLIFYYLSEINPFFRKILALFLDIIWEIHYFLNISLFGIWAVQVNILKILIFIFFIYIWFTLAKFYKTLVLKLKREYPNISPSTFTIFANIGYYFIVTIIILSSVKIIWIDLSSLGLIVWALSVWIWFWLQNIVSNFISGIILMFEWSIRVGDYIEVDEKLRWIVTNLSLRSITIKTNDNIELVIPNQKFIENNIVNRTLNDKKVRFKIPFWVAYGTKVKDVEKTVLNALKESKIDFYLKSGAYKPQIVMQWMNSSSVDFWLFVWVKWDATLTPKRTKSEFLKLIYTALNDAGIVIPFPQQDVYIKQMPELNVKLNERE